MVFGGLIAMVKPWVKKGDDIHKQSRLTREKQLERVSMSAVSLLDHSRTLQSGDLLRGDGYSAPDLVGDYTQSIIKLIRLSTRIDNNVDMVSWTSKILLYSFLSAAGFAIFSFIHSPARQASPWIAAALLLVQLIVVALNYSAWSNIYQLGDHD